MARLLPKPRREVERLLRHFGFVFLRHGKEDVWGRASDARTVIVPRHRAGAEQIPVGTLKSILFQAGLSREEAIRFWER